MINNQNLYVYITKLKISNTIFLENPQLKFSSRKNEIKKTEYTKRKVKEKSFLQ